MPSPEDDQNQPRKVVITEIIKPGDPRYKNTSKEDNSSQYKSYSFNGPNGQQFRFSQFYMPMDRGGCLSASITFFLFLICLGEFGALAAIGFIVFYAIGSVLGAVRAGRQLMAGLPCNPWAWRAGNWIVSFLLTVWLAGGLNK